MRASKVPRAESPARKTQGGHSKREEKGFEKDIRGEGAGSLLRLLGEDGFGASWLFGGSCGGVKAGGCGLFAGGCRGDVFVVVALLVDEIGRAHV